MANWQPKSVKPISDDGLGVLEWERVGSGNSG